MRLGRALSVCLAGLTALTGAAVPFSAANNGQLIPPALSLAGATRLGAYTASLSVTIGLSPRHQSELRQLIARSRGHAFLTSDQFLARYAPGAQVADEAAAWLRAAGFNSVSVSPDRMLVTARAGAATVSQALRTDIGRYRFADGSIGFAAATRPAVPAELAGSVTSVMGLDSREVANSFLLTPPRSPEAAPFADACGNLSPNIGQTYTIHCHTPAEIWNAYDFPGAPQSGGAGQRVGIITADGWTDAALGLNSSQAPLRMFEHQFGLPFARVTLDYPSAPPDPSTATDETELDVQWVSALAPAAAITVFDAADASMQSLTQAIEAWVQSGIAIGSISWGSCESLWYAVNADSVVDGLLSEAAAEGHTLFAASGDYGGACAATSVAGTEPVVPGVVFPASDAYAIAVGGTTLYSEVDGTYVDETAWGSDQAGGGGISALSSRPAWQTANPAPRRALPDVSFDADPLTGFAIYDTAGNLIEVGGTSASAPAWAAVYAIQLQHDASAGISPAFAGPRLYGLGGPLAPAAGMHDVVQGSNLSYPATVGWDLATGLGSPDVARLLARLAG